MKMEFDEDESLILMIYAGESREETIAALRGMIYKTATDEAELRELGSSVIGKLERMTDEEFAAMDIYAAM